MDREPCLLYTSLYNGTLKVDLYQYFGQRVKRQEVK